MKPSILIIADRPNWAYYQIQQFIKQNVSDQFDVYCDFLIFNTLKKSKNPLKGIKSIIAKNRFQDIRKDQTYDIVVYLAFYFPEHINIKWKAKKIIKGIYTDGFPPSNSNFTGNLEEFKKRFLNDSNAIVCGSEIIKKFYLRIMDKVFYANSIISGENFKRIVPKEINTSSSFIVGWTGNPDREFKGFYTHIIPAVELVQKRYPEIQLKTRFSGPMETLPRFYDDLDVVIIASDADAGPSLFGEASLMEIPCISTNIGWPREVIRNKENGFIVAKEIKDIANRLAQLYEDRQLLFNMSKLIRNDFITVFNKDQMVNNWKEVFNTVLKKK